MRKPVAAVVAALIGVAVMALELTAVRLMAPHFGDNSYVWTNVIGVILVALAVGAFLGGRMADKDHGVDRVFALLLAGGLLTALVPVASTSLGAWLVPATLPLDSAMGALVRGSLAATTLLFAPPVLLVACVSPMLVTILASEDGRVGPASGLVSAMATLGSLVGTFAATHVLIPELGSRWTVWICSGCLIVAALVCRMRPAVAVALLVPVGLSFVVPGGLKPARDGEQVLAEVESQYQYLQVVSVKDAEPRQVHLKINEGLDSFHSVSYEGTAFTGGSYYDYHVIAPYLARDSVTTSGTRVLSLGEAAGTFGRLFAHVHPGCEMDGVEIDPAVMRLGDEYFKGKRPPGRQFPIDARVYVERTTSRYDVVLVDTYKHQIYIPAHVASRQFFTAVARVLNDGGVVSVNAGGTRFDDPVIGVMCSTMASVFGEAWAFRVPQSRNFVLMARKAKPLTFDVLATVKTSDEDLATVLRKAGPKTAWRRFTVGDVVLDDDRPFLDVLQEEVYSRVESAPVLTTMAGDRDPAEVEAEVIALRQQGRIEDALASLSSSEAATTQLRYLAGDCRWLLRDTQGATLEYREAKLLGMESDRLDSYIRMTEAETAGRLEAWSTATRNGWIAGVSLFALLGLAYLARRV